MRDGWFRAGSRARGCGRRRRRRSRREFPARTEARSRGRARARPRPGGAEATYPVVPLGALALQTHTRDPRRCLGCGQARRRRTAGNRRCPGRGDPAVLTTSPALTRLVRAAATKVAFEGRLRPLRSCRPPPRDDLQSFEDGHASMVVPLTGSGVSRTRYCPGIHMSRRYASSWHQPARRIGSNSAVSKESGEYAARFTLPLLAHLRQVVQRRAEQFDRRVQSPESSLSVETVPAPATTFRVTTPMIVAPFSFPYSCLSDIAAAVATRESPTSAATRTTTCALRIPDPLFDLPGPTLSDQFTPPRWFLRWLGAHQ